MIEYKVAAATWIEVAAGYGYWDYEWEVIENGEHSLPL